MSKYTTEVRYICEKLAGFSESVGYSKASEAISKSRTKVFNFDYPIFDNNYRNVLETKILRHYYTREIGFETVGLWQFWLNTRLNEIMPYYNKLYESELLKFNPLYEVDLTTDYSKNLKGEENKNTNYSENTNSKHDIDTEEEIENESSTESEKNGTNKRDTSNTTDESLDHWDYYSDTPQGGVNGLADMTYLTNARHIVDTNHTANIGVENGETTDSGRVDVSGSSNTNKSTTDIGTGSKSGNSTDKTDINNVESYLQHVKGKNSGTSFSKLLTEYRETFINIDMMIIRDLSDLFMNIW